MPLPSQPPQEGDPFTSLLHLEDDLYTTAYTLGATDGAKAGKVEGRIFGLEKGFEKFAALGVLHGRSLVWGGRSSQLNSGTIVTKHKDMEEVGKESNGEGKAKVDEDEDGAIHDASEASTQDQASEADNEEKSAKALPNLPSLSRLPPHITLLHSLTDLATFSTENSEEGVADLDDRFKRGQSKAKLIELLVKEPSSVEKLRVFEHGKGSTRKGVKASGGGEGVKNGDNMEDFGGSRLLR